MEALERADDWNIHPGNSPVLSDGIATSAFHPERTLNWMQLPAA
jgi:hypothetical protein